MLLLFLSVGAVPPTFGIKIMCGARLLRRTNCWLRTIPAAFLAKSNPVGSRFEIVGYQSTYPFRLYSGYCDTSFRHGDTKNLSSSNTNNDSNVEDSQELHFFPRRAMLYVPASDGRKVEKAHTLNVDSIVYDIEDGVAMNHKVCTMWYYCTRVVVNENLVK